MNKPQKSHRSDGKIKYGCDFCMYCTDRKDLYTRHQYIHSDDKPFICYACGKLFNRADHVKKHFFRIHADQMYDSSLTRRHYDRQQPNLMHHAITTNLQTMVAAASIPTMVTMPKCFPKQEQQQLQQHQQQLLEHHQPKTENCPVRVKPSKTYQCMYCTWKGVDSWCLRRHLNTHIKPYKCVICDYKGARADRLIKHTLRIHRKHICLRCGIQFDTEEEKDAHLRLCRLTVENRKCMKCQAVYTTKGDLSTHCIVAHGMELLMCTHCDFKTALVEDFESHGRQHQAPIITHHDVTGYAVMSVMRPPLLHQPQQPSTAQQHHQSQPQPPPPPPPPTQQQHHQSQPQPPPPPPPTPQQQQAVMQMTS